MPGYSLRPKDKPLLIETMTSDEIIAKLKELEPEVERVKREMERQRHVDADIFWNFRFTI